MADPIDIAVGKEVARTRKLRGFTQTEVGNALGLTFQQIQKYEKGSNRISASKLMNIAAMFNVRPESFFELANNEPLDEPKYDREAIKLCQYFIKLKPAMQKELLSFVKAVAAN